MIPDGGGVGGKLLSQDCFPELTGGEAEETVNRMLLHTQRGGELQAVKGKEAVKNSECHVVLRLQGERCVMEPRRAIRSPKIHYAFCCCLFVCSYRQAF